MMGSLTIILFVNSHRERLAPNILSSSISDIDSDDVVVEVFKALLPLLRLCNH